MGNQKLWLQDDGQPITCTEKLRVLDENWAELHSVMQDAFEDAVLMGVSETALREQLTGLVSSLVSPKVGRAA